MVAHAKRNSAQLFCAVPTQNDLALSSLLFSAQPTRKLGYPISACANRTLPYFFSFFSARFSMLAEKSVAVRLLHRGAITPVSSPVPQAHSSTVSAGRISAATVSHSVRLAFRLMTLAKTSYTQATLSQNIRASCQGTNSSMMPDSTAAMPAMPTVPNSHLTFPVM